MTNQKENTNEDDLFTDEGIPSSLAQEELMKHINQNYGKVKILSQGKSLEDIMGVDLSPEAKD